MAVDEKILTYASKYGSAEVVINRESETEVSFENELFKNVSSGSTTILKVRITKNKKYGFAQTTNLVKWRECVDSAYKLMKVNEPLLNNPGLSSTDYSKGFKGSHELKLLSSEELIKNILLMIKGVKEVNRGLRAASASISVNTSNTSFMNSNGSNALYENCIISSGIQCIKGQASGYDYNASRSADINFVKMGIEAAKMCIKSLNPKKVKPQKADLTIDYWGIIELIDLLSKSFDASKVLEGKSMFKDKIGLEIINPKISITDDATLKKGIGAQPIDAEGTDSKSNELIINGVLKGFLHDNYTAKRMKTESTGNCATMALRPGINYNNLIIKNGTASNDEFVSDGFYTYNLMGSHMANPVSGDFALNLLNAFKISDGEWIPIRDAMISGNLFKLWKNVEAVGREARMDSSIIAPLIRFKNVQIVA